MPSRIAPLTGLRAVAAAGVCLTHAAFYTGEYTNDLTGTLWSRLEVGVPVFFALSGFLLFRPWIAALRAGAATQPSLRAYAWHRFRKVGPAYWAVVSAVYLIGLVRVDPNPSGQGFGNYLRHLSFTQIYGLGHLRVGLTQTWSMAVEVAFYLLLPLLGWFLTAVVCRYRWRPARLLAALAMIAAISPAWILIAPDVGLSARLWPPASLWWFLGGMALTVIAVDRRWSTARTLACLGTALVVFLVAVPAAVAGGPTLVPMNPAQAVGKAALYLVFAMAVIAPLAIAPAERSYYHRFLSLRPLVWLGFISYEIFLLHLMIMELVLSDLFGWRPFTGNPVLAFVVVWAITVPLAWALHAVLPFGDNRRTAVLVGRRRGGGT